MEVLQIFQRHFLLDRKRRIRPYMTLMLTAEEVDTVTSRLPPCGWNYASSKFRRLVYFPRIQDSAIWGLSRLSGSGIFGYQTIGSGVTSRSITTSHTILLKRFLLQEQATLVARAYSTCYSNPLYITRTSGGPKCRFGAVVNARPGFQ